MPRIPACFAVILLTAPQLAIAKEPIKGAFGVVLGLTAPKVPNRFAKLPSGEAAFRFLPKNKVRFFDAYYYFTTPTSKVVYKIVALSPSYQEKQACRADLRTVRFLLSKKYGPMQKKGAPVTGTRYFHFVIGDYRTILLYCSLTIGEGYTLSLQYSDELWAESAENERTKRDSKSINSKGL